MFPRLEVTSSDEAEVATVEKTQQQINNYAKLGLRVLVMGKRVLAEEEYKLWVQVSGECLKDNPVQLKRKSMANIRSFLFRVASHSS